MATLLDDILKRLRQGAQTVSNAINRNPIANTATNIAINSNPLTQSLNAVRKSTQLPQVQSFIKPIKQEIFDYATKQAPAASRIAPLTQPYQNPIGFGNAVRQQLQNFQENGIRQGARNFAEDIFNTGKFAANTFGGPRLLTKAGAVTLGSNAGLGGILNKIGGGSFSEGAGKGVATAPSIMGITRFSNPVIEKVTGKVAPKIAPRLTATAPGNYIATSTIRGLQNVPEGAVMDATLGRRPFSPESVALDFVSGFIPSKPNTRGSVNVNANAKQIQMPQKDRDIVTKTLERMLENKDNADYQIRFRQKDEDQLRVMAEQYLNKTVAWKAPFQEVAQHLFDRAKVDADEMQFGLPGLGLVNKSDYKVKVKPQAQIQKEVGDYSRQLEYAKKFESYKDFKDSLSYIGTGSADKSRLITAIQKDFGSLENFWRKANGKELKVRSGDLGLNSQPYLKQKSFTQPGSATNTKADQIAGKFRTQEQPRKIDPFEAEMDAQVGKPLEKPFSGKSRVKSKTPTQLPGDQATTNFATARATMGGGGLKGLPRQVQDAFQKWVNTRRATQLEGILKKKEFKDLDSKGIKGIFEFQSGNKSGRFADVKRYFDTKYKELKDNLIQFDYRQDYLPQLWNNTKEEVDKVLGRRMGLKPSFTLDAVFRSYQEGINAGLKPRFKNISDLVGWYEQKANKAIADKNFFDFLGKDGQLLPSTKAPLEWETLDPDRFPKFLSQIGDEKFAGTYKAPKELAELINGYLRDPNARLEKIANYVAGVKSIALNFGVPGTAINAHGINILARHVLMGTGGNPISRLLTGTKYMFNQKAASGELDKVITRAPKAISDGLMLSSDDYSSRIVDPVGFKQKFGKKWEQVFGDPLFNKMLPALKISSYEELVKNGMNGKDAAKLVNNVYGGINWEQLGRNKNWQNFLRVAILAPDWAESTLRLGGNFAKALNLKDGSKPMERYRTMMVTIVGSYVLHNIINKYTSGHYSFQNEPSNIFNIEIGYTDEGEKRYFRPYGTGLDMIRLPAEVAMGIYKGDLSGLGRTIKNRLSIPAGVLLGVATDQDYRGNAIGYRGTDRFGNPMPLEQRATNIGTELASLVGVPSFVKQLGLSATGQQSLEAGLTQGLELPTRYQNPGKSKTQDFVGNVSGLEGKELYDLKQRFKGESPFSDNQKAIINQGGMEALDQIMQLREQKRLIKDVTETEEKISIGEITPEEGQKTIESILQSKGPTAKVAGSSTSKAYASDTVSSDLQESLAKNRVKISGKSEMTENSIIYPTDSGTGTIDLSPPTKGTGIGAFANKNWNITKARDIWNNDKISPELKAQALKKLGIGNGEQVTKVGKLEVSTREIDKFPFPDYAKSSPGQVLRADLNFNGTGNADIVFHMKTPDGKIIDVPQTTEEFKDEKGHYGLELQVPSNIKPGVGEVWATVNGQEVAGTRKPHEIVNTKPIDRYSNKNRQTMSNDPTFARQVINQGMTVDDVRYDALANYTNDEKTQYIISKSPTKEKLIENILTGRKKSIGENIFASDGVIDALVDEGEISKEEAKYLKSIDYNKDGTLKASSSGSGGKKGSGKAKAKAIAELLKDTSFGASKLFLDNVKTSRPTNVARLDSILQRRSPSNNGLKSIQQIIAQSESLVKKKKPRYAILATS